MCGGVKLREDQGGGGREGKFGIRFSAGEFEVSFDFAGGRGGRREGFGYGVGDVEWGRGPGGAFGGLVGHQEGVEAAGMEEVGVCFIEEGISPEFEEVRLYPRRYGRDMKVECTCAVAERL